MLAGDVSADAGGLDRVLSEYVKTGDGIASDLVEVELYAALVLEVKGLHGDHLRRPVTEIHLADLDPVTVVYLRDIVFLTILSIGLHAPGGGHGLGLYALVGIDGTDR